MMSQGRLLIQGRWIVTRTLEVVEALSWKTRPASICRVKKGWAHEILVTMTGIAGREMGTSTAPGAPSTPPRGGDLVLVRDREPVLGLVQDVQHHLSDAVSVGGLVLLAHDLDVPQLPEVKVALLLQTPSSQLHLHHLC